MFQILLFAKSILAAKRRQKRWQGVQVEGPCRGPSEVLKARVCGQGALKGSRVPAASALCGGQGQKVRARPLAIALSTLLQCSEQKCARDQGRPVLALQGFPARTLFDPLISLEGRSRRLCKQGRMGLSVRGSSWSPAVYSASKMHQGALEEEYQGESWKGC